MISFNNEEIRFTLKNKSVLKRWIQTTIQKKKRKTGDIAFVFCSDDYLLQKNIQHLQHDTLTDIITFDYSSDESINVISGDIFISVDRVKENATKFSKTTDNELHRVMIHGVLHLLGYTDKTKVNKQVMTEQEDLCLKELKKILPSA